MSSIIGTVIDGKHAIFSFYMEWSFTVMSKIPLVEML